MAVLLVFTPCPHSPNTYLQGLPKVMPQANWHTCGPLALPEQHTVHSALPPSLGSGARHCGQRGAENQRAVG